MQAKTVREYIERLKVTGSDIPCHSCSICCKGFITLPGELELILDQIEANKIDLLDLHIYNLRDDNNKSYQVWVDGEYRQDDKGKYTLVDKPCALLNGGCKIYNYRPIDCRSYPCEPIKIDGKLKFMLAEECHLELTKEVVLKHMVEWAEIWHKLDEILPKSWWKFYSDRPTGKTKLFDLVELRKLLF